jgi:hypothetical protein
MDTVEKSGNSEEIRSQTGRNFRTTCKGNINDIMGMKPKLAFSRVLETGYSHGKVYLSWEGLIFNS